MSEYMSVAEVRELLRNEGQENLNEAQKKALDHAEKTSSITVEEARRIAGEIAAIPEMVEFYTEDPSRPAYFATKIVDILCNEDNLPASTSQIRAVLQEKRGVLGSEKIGDIMSKIMTILGY